MDWTAGYASDVEYTAGFYREQSPVYLNFVCVLHGFEPVPLDQPYNYFELGFGRGLTINLLAASNPNGNFYAADFNPAHVAGARQLAASAQLDNLTLLENSFEELAQGKVADLPQFDFITLHGIYTWITAENRRHIVAFLARYLKPGGLVYLSYNAMPGWAMSLPLQRLLVEHGDLYPNRSDKQIDQAATFVERMVALNAGYFSANPGLKPRLDMLQNGSRNYLVHEYMHKHWQPLYFADVARDLADAKLDFIGSAELPYAYQGLYLTAERQELLNSINDRTVRETLLDYFLNTGFRKDVFVRGARRTTAVRQAEYLANTGLALMLPRADVNLTMKLAIGEVNAKKEIYNPVLDAITHAPKTLADLGKQAYLAQQTYGNLTEISAILTASNQTGIYFNDRQQHDGAAAKRLNKVLAEQIRYGDDYQALCSPLLGNGIAVNYLDRLLYLAMVQNPGVTDVHRLAEAGWKIMTMQKRHMIIDGITLNSDAENITAIADKFGRALEDIVPVWRQLQIL